MLKIDGLAEVMRQRSPMWLRYRLMDLRGRGEYSYYADRFKCIFIHVPKVAGTSIAQTLFGQGSRHVPYYEYKVANGWKFRRYFKFAFVRNPWDRLVSAFFFLRKGGLSEPDRLWSMNNLAAFDDFESFVMGWLSRESVQAWVHFKPQHYWICDREQTVMVDFVGRYESIGSDFKLVADRLGCSRSLPLVNQSNHRHYSAYYSPEMRRKVAAVYREDVETFKYSFDEGPF